MVKHRHISSILLPFVCLFIGCSSQENNTDTNIGRINITAHIEGGDDVVYDKTISLTLISADGKFSHTWPNIDDFPTYEVFYDGSYHATAFYGEVGSEGYGCPCFIGEADFEVRGGETTNVDIACTLSQAQVSLIIGNDFSDRYQNSQFILHTKGHNFIEIDPDEVAPVYLSPGDMSLQIALNNVGNQPVIIVPDIIIPIESEQLYTVNIDLVHDDVLKINCGDLHKEMTLSQEVLDSPTPAMTCIGFTRGEPVILTEGFPSERPIALQISSILPLSHLMITAIGDDVVGNNIFSESDLLNPESPYYDDGLTLNTDADGLIIVDFTHLLENLSVLTSTDVQFLCQAFDKLGRASEIVELSVSIVGVEISVVNQTEAIIGINQASVALKVNVPKVEENDFSLYIENLYDNRGSRVEIDRFELDESNQTVRLYFTVPEGIDDVSMYIEYMGNRKANVTIKRGVPKFSLSADAFATAVRFRITADTPEEIAAICQNVNVIYGEKENMAVIERDKENGILVCTGLAPSTKYTVQAAILDDGIKPSCTFVTESAKQIPDGDFEDVIESIKYKDLPSGGIYASSAFPIFNQQNMVDVSVYWPKKYWASINAKTFCNNGSNQNTWFMQPSAATDYDYYSSGSKSIRLSTVGWSLQGQEIEPYTQAPDSYQAYSGNVPSIDRISAGYLFLGDYSFNPSAGTEVYTEGIVFESRPSSLNGYYRYIPSINGLDDRGWVELELLGRLPDGTEIIIADGRAEFVNNNDMRTFNMPIHYKVYGVKAEKLKIMFCTSTHTDELSFDDPLVPVAVNIPEARYYGSQLWIDNLTFSY